MAVPYILKYPFTHQSTQYTQITLRRPKGRDMRAMANVKTDLDQAMVMIQQLAELTAEEVDEIDVADIAELGTLIEKMMADDGVKKSS